MTRRTFAIDRDRVDRIVSAPASAHVAALFARDAEHALRSEIAAAEEDERRAEHVSIHKYVPKPENLARIAQLKAKIPKAVADTSAAAEEWAAAARLARVVDEHANGARRYLGNQEIERPRR
ncbi:outer membrane murein-binding lipoprotein Lpp [Bosea sp. BE125]|uniref:hypothetical protein n=1 Tax=Bosea sp. BE125 TaxID=2817909 RepID=UPI00285763EA|nr:hypothetical protein [Bosea sp. BE125]MDR6871148.1 outer membrane murein-binding lipoprotein Lpp [Bosea sp. BE125]